MKFFRFWANYFRILRCMFTLWLLRKLSFEEYLPLTVYGRFIAMEGDIAILQHGNGAIEVSEVVKAYPHANTIHLRIYRRPR